MSGPVKERAPRLDAGPAGAARRRRLIHVAAGVLTDGADRVLLAQRPEGKHLAGGWEFPGGKVEPGETRYEALARELKEELGIELAAARPLIRARHRYPQRDILLDVWVVTAYHGEPVGLDGQALRWCARAELPAAKLLPADRPIVTALRLPERLTSAAGVDYRVDDFPAPRDGIDEHSVATIAPLWGARCDGPQEALAAAAAGADFLVLRKSLAASELAALCDSVQIPVYANGISLQAAWVAGAIGVGELG